MTAQIRLVKNVVRMGQTLRLFWANETGVTYAVRYEFGALTGTAAESLTTGTLEWVLDSDTFSAEMVGITMDGMLYLDTYDSTGSLLGTSQVDFTVASANILIPSFSADYVNIGETIRMSVNSSNWVYSPRSNYPGYTCGNASGSIRLDYEGYLPTKWYSDWTPPISLAKEYPDQTSFYVEVTLETDYYNSLSATHSVIGTVVCRLEVRVPDNDSTKPSVTMKTEAESTLGDAFDGLYIRGKTKVRVTLEAASATSEIAGQTIQAGSEMAAGTEALFDLTADTMSIRATVTDKRGYGRTVTEAISAMAYSGPSVTPVSGYTKVICARASADGTENPKGENLLIRAARRYTSIGSGLNKCILRYRIKPVGGEYSAWRQLLGESDSDSEYSGVVSGVALAVKTAYTVQISVVDTIGESHIITFPVVASGVPVHVGKGNRNVSVGGYCDYGRKDVFDMHFTQYFFTGAAAQALFEDGSWAAGAELSAAIPEADLTSVGTYNLLIAVSGGVPVLLVKAGSIIAGGGIRMEYTETDGTERLTLTEAAAPVTALYKLL